MKTESSEMVRDLPKVRGGAGQDLGQVPHQGGSDSGAATPCGTRSPPSRAWERSVCGPGFAIVWESCQCEQLEESPAWGLVPSGCFADGGGPVPSLNPSLTPVTRPGTQYTSN